MREPTGDLSLDSHKLQYHPDRVADFLAGRLVWPLYAEISPTSVCNHRCRFCNFNRFGHAAMRLPEGRMPALMEELKHAGVRAVVLAGSGEPCLHPDTFPALRKAREIRLDAAMSTNGVLLREEQLREMPELLAWVRFSINGGAPSAYAAVQGAAGEDLGQALDNLGRLAEWKARTGSGLTIGAQCLLLPENKDSLAVLARRLKSLGADYFSVKHFYPHADNPYRPEPGFPSPALMRELGELAGELSDREFVMMVRDPGNLRRERPYRECLGLPFLAYVREDGRLYTCFSHQEDDLTAVGSLLEHDFSALWNSAGREASIRHVNQFYDKNECQANCRHHQINLWLRQLRNPPAHVNFI